MFNMLNILDELSNLQYRIFEGIANETPYLVVSQEIENKLVACGLIIVNETLLHFDDKKPPRLIKNYIVPGHIKYRWLLHVAEGTLNKFQHVAETVQ